MLGGKKKCRGSLSEIMAAEEKKKNQRAAVHVDGHRTKWYQPEDGPKRSFADIQREEAKAVAADKFASTSAGWSCGSCTFINTEMSHLMCSMCGTQRSSVGSLGGATAAAAIPQQTTKGSGSRRGSRRGRRR